MLPNSCNVVAGRRVYDAPNCFTSVDIEYLPFGSIEDVDDVYLSV